MLKILLQENQLIGKILTMNNYIIFVLNFHLFFIILHYILKYIFNYIF